MRRDTGVTDSKASGIVGLDIGGANLKIADPLGNAQAIPFPMWTDHRRLGHRLKELIAEFSRKHATAPEQLAITMTGEMADCFQTRRQGVSEILDQVALAFSESETYVYAVGGSWYPPRQARQRAWEVASSNWYALAAWIQQSRSFERTPRGLIVDIGSTTIDCIPIGPAGVATQAKTDRQRMQRQQLLYTGIRRTPIAAILPSVVIDQQACPLMAERFATSDDAYLALGLTQENAGDCDSADGRPRTRLNAISRLAHMVGEDAETLPEQTILDIAQQVVDAQAHQLASAIRANVPENLGGDDWTIYLTGHGGALFDAAHRELVGNELVGNACHGCRIRRLDELSGASAARAAPAVAVAWLLARHNRRD